MTLAIALPWISGDGESLGSPGIGSSDLIWIIVGTAAYLAIPAMFGVGIGALLTNQVVAVVLVMVVLFIADPVLAGLIGGYSKFSLLTLGNVVSGGVPDSSEDTFSALVSSVIYLGYTAAVLIAAALVSSRRDVS